MKRACIAFGAAFLTGPLAVPAATVPDWAKPILAADASSIADTEGAVVLASLGEAHYLTPDSVRHTHREVIRILSEAGRSRARASLGYNADTARIISARAWVIDPSGRRVEEIKQRDFTDAVSGASALFWNSSRSMQVNAAGRVIVGSAFAWEFITETQGGVFDVHWAFRDALPVWWSRFEVIPPAGTPLRWRRSHPSVPDPVAGPGGARRWEMQRIVTSSLQRPDGFLIDDLEVTARADAASRKEGALRSWDEFNQLVASIVEPRIEISEPVRTKAAELTAAGATRWQRIRALCAFAQADVQYLSLTLDHDHLAGYRPHLSTEVLQNRIGDCKDKAAMLVALLRAIGDRGFFVLVHARDRLAISEDWPTTSFNHAIVAIPVDADTPAHWPVIDAGPLGRVVLFDPTHPGVPLGALPTNDQGRYVLVTSVNGGACVLSPVDSVAQARIERSIAATITRTGMLEVKGTETVIGATAAELNFRRTSLLAGRFGQEIAARLQESLPAIEALHWTDAWEPLNSRLRLDLEFNVPRFVRAVGSDSWLVRPLAFVEKFALAPWKTPIEGSAWLPTLSLHQTARLALPAGVAIAELPKDFTFDETGLTVRCAYRSDADTLVAELTIERPARLLDRAAYDTWRAAHQRIDDALRQPAILRRAANP